MGVVVEVMVGVLHIAKTPITSITIVPILEPGCLPIVAITNLSQVTSFNFPVPCKRYLILTSDMRKNPQTHCRNKPVQSSNSCAYFHHCCILRIPDQNGINQACYIVEIHHSGMKRSICFCGCFRTLQQAKLSQRRIC